MNNIKILPMNKIKTQASNVVPQVYVIQNKYRAIFDASLQHKLVVSKIALKSSEIYIYYPIIIQLLDMKLHPHWQSKY